MMWILFWDIILMESISIFTINVEKKFLKLWYKKNKITFQYIFHSQKQGEKMAYEEVFEGKLIVVPSTTSNEEYEVELKEEPTEAHE